ncbi:MAG: hypothetical protein QOH57_623 [Mycobacterium sp.]|jgi:hypothetical protein|nr:hypothetical protein [Mycobacterium sp.]
MNTKTIATTYFESWNERDFDRLKSILASDVTFSGPMGTTASGAEEYIASLSGFAESLDGVRVEKMLADDEDVLTWFYLIPKTGDPVSVVNWCHIEGGLVQRVRVTFDPRPLL